MIHYEDEFDRNANIIEDITRYLRGIRLSYREAQVLIDHILRSMNPSESDHLLYEMYNYLGEQFGRVPRRNQYAMRPSEEEEYQKLMIEMQLNEIKTRHEIIDKELILNKELLKKAWEPKPKKDFLSEDECKID